MFGCIVAGRLVPAPCPLLLSPQPIGLLPSPCVRLLTSLRPAPAPAPRLPALPPPPQVQTNLQQVDLNKWVFELPDAATINHIVAFLLGTIPFEPGFAATVHFLWPGKPWQLLGMLSNEKPSAIFRLRATASKSSSSSDPPEISMDDDTLPSQLPVTATLGISIEPIAAVQAQVAVLQSTSASTALVPIPTVSSANADPGMLATRILQHLVNFVTSFATNTVPLGSIALGSDTTYLPLKAFQNWYETFGRKMKTDPGFLLKDS